MSIEWDLLKWIGGAVLLLLLVLVAFGDPIGKAKALWHLWRGE